MFVFPAAAMDIWLLHARLLISWWVSRTRAEIVHFFFTLDAGFLSRGVEVALRKLCFFGTFPSFNIFTPCLDQLKKEEEGEKNSRYSRLVEFPDSSASNFTLVSAKLELMLQAVANQSQCPEARWLHLPAL